MKLYSIAKSAIGSFLMATILTCPCPIYGQDTDTPADNLPTEYYIYQLEETAGALEITGRAQALGTEMVRLSDNFLASVVGLPQGCKFIISTDGNAMSLTQMEEGSRRYPAQADATMSMFTQVKFESTPTDGCPEYFTAPTLADNSSQTLRLVAFLARSEPDWSQGGAYKTKSIQMAPADLTLQVRPVTTPESEFTAVQPLIEDGMFRYHYDAPSTGAYEFAYNYNNGRDWCVATGGSQDKTNMISFNKPGEGRNFQVSQQTTVTDEWQNTSNLLFQIPAQVNNKTMMQEGQPYEFIFDLNETLGGEWNSHPVYVDQWISGTMDADILLHADVTHQGTNQAVNIQGAYGYFNVPLSADGSETKNVHAYRFDLDYDLITSVTQNEFYFDVMPRGETDTQNRLFTIVPAGRNKETVRPDYINSIQGISFDNANAPFIYGGFQEGKRYSFFIEPSTGNVWMTVNDAVTGTDSLMVTDPEEAPAVYYNLRGQRVDHPIHGIFIELRGSQARKVAL